MGYFRERRISCNYATCDYEATSKRDLKEHKKDIHVC